MKNVKGETVWIYVDNEDVLEVQSASYFRDTCAFYAVSMGCASSVDEARKRVVQCRITPVATKKPAKKKAKRGVGK